MRVSTTKRSREFRRADMTSPRRIHLCSHSRARFISTATSTRHVDGLTDGYLAVEPAGTLADGGAGRRLRRRAAEGARRRRRREAQEKRDQGEGRARPGEAGKQETARRRAANNAAERPTFARKQGAMGVPEIRAAGCGQNELRRAGIRSRPATPSISVAAAEDLFFLFFCAVR